MFRPITLSEVCTHLRLRVRCLPLPRGPVAVSSPGIGHVDASFFLCIGFFGGRLGRVSWWICVSCILRLAARRFVIYVVLFYCCCCIIRVDLCCCEFVDWGLEWCLLGRVGHIGGLCGGCGHCVTAFLLFAFCFSFCFALIGFWHAPIKVWGWFCVCVMGFGGLVHTPSDPK